MSKRVYSNTAVKTTLSGGINASSPSVNVVSTAGWPTPGANEVALAALNFGDGAAVEVVTYTGKTSTSLTGLSRGVDGTTAKSHSAGASVVHVASARDMEYARLAGAKVIQASLGATVAPRPILPPGYVEWYLFNKPGTAPGPLDVDVMDIVYNISGVEWT